MSGFKLIFKLSIFKDIRFWIFLFFIIRLTGITNPPLEVAHNWRQTTVTMVARNFIETNPSIFYPQVDFAGEKTGITGMEFPFLNYLIYLVSLVFGYEHWYGRIINMIVSSIGIFYFFKIVRKYFSEKEAFYSSIVLLSSIWFAYSRKIMPDTFSMSLVIIGFYFGTNFLDTGRRKILNLLLYFVFILFGILSKLPSGFILILFSVFLVNKDIDWKTKIAFCFVNLIAIIPVGIWYLNWVPHLVEQFGFWHFFMGKSIMQGITEIWENLQKSLANFYDSALKFIGFALFLFGIIKSIFNKNKKIQLVFVLSFLAFLLVVFKGGLTFALHAYYVIPFVPVMALVCGYGIVQAFSEKIILILLCAISIEGILNQQHDFFLKENQIAITSLEPTLDKFSKRSDLIVVNSKPCPTPMYFTHRKGWIATNEQIENIQFMDSIQALGCKYIVILKKYFGTDIQLHYAKISDNEHFTMYKL